MELLQNQYNTLTETILSWPPHSWPGELFFFYNIHILTLSLVYIEWKEHKEEEQIHFTHD